MGSDDEKGLGVHVSWYEQNHNKTFIIYLLITTIMMIWPWIFFGVVVGLHGIPMQHHVARVANAHPQDVAFFVTTICNVISMITAHLFSKAAASVAQKWVVHKDADVANISFFTALKNRAPPIYLYHQGRFRYAAIVVLYIVIFTFVTPGITALLLPVPFNRKASLSGKELDFASNDTDCVNWFNENIIPDTCGWESYNGFNYTDCITENQLVDVLESGRGNILSLISNNTVSLTFTQLGAVGGLHLLGTTGGVLPLGPNGVPAFDTLAPSPISGAASKLDLSYNYTLDLQGMSSNVTCAYSSVPVVQYYNPLPGIYQYNGTCPPGQDFLVNTSFIVIGSNSSLGFWACQTSKSGSAYTVYLEGIRNYSQAIGNIQCNISPVQPALFRLNYNGQAGIFSINNSTVSTWPTTSTELISRSVMSLGDVVREAQNDAANLVAESVITFGVKNFNLPPLNQSSEYLKLYEAMIQGMMDYQATYIRLLYSAKAFGLSPAPSSCIRSVNGTAEYAQFGWTATAKTGGYLVLTTLVNLTTIVLFSVAMSTQDRGEQRLPTFDPTEPESLILSADASGDLLRTATANPSDRAAGNAKVAFGQDNTDKIVRLWVKPIAKLEIPPVD